MGSRRIVVMLAAVMAVSAGSRAVGIERITVPKKPIRIPGLTLPLVKPDYPEIGTSNASKLTLLWKTKLVEGGIVYTGSAKGIYAVDAAKGTPKWNLNPVSARATSPVVKDTRVFWLANGMLYAFDTSTGDQKWAADAPYSSAPTPIPLVNGALFVPGSKVYALDAHTGAPLWTYEVPGNLFNSLAAMGKSMVFGVCRGEVYAFTVH